jgi:hypothetical protein
MPALYCRWQSQTWILSNFMGLFRYPPACSHPQSLYFPSLGQYGIREKLAPGCA